MTPEERLSQIEALFTTAAKYTVQLFPLTSPELQQIAEKTLNSRTNTIFN